MLIRQFIFSWFLKWEINKIKKKREKIALLGKNLYWAMNLPENWYFYQAIVLLTCHKMSCVR